MKRKLILNVVGILLIANSQSSMAAQWASIAKNEKASYYIDRDSIRKSNDGFVEFWVKINFINPKLSNDKSMKYLSEKDLMLVDCKRRVYKQPYAIAFTMSDGGGEVVSDYKNSNAEEIPIIPESISDFYRLFVCKTQ